MPDPTDSIFILTTRMFDVMEDDLRYNAPQQAESLFLLALGQFLLGRSIESEIDGWLAALFSKFTFSGDRRTDVRRWTNLVACDALRGRPVVEQARSFSVWLGPPQPSDDYGIAQYGLALAKAGNRIEAARIWAEWVANLTLLPQIDDFRFELLSVAGRDAGNVSSMQETFDADAVAYIGAKSFSYPQPCTAASHICALVGARSAPKTTLDALYDRLRDIDRRQLDEKAMALANFSVSAQMRRKAQSKHLHIALTAQGRGELSPVAAALRPVAARLEAEIAERLGATIHRIRREMQPKPRLVVECELRPVGNIVLKDAAKAEIARRFETGRDLASRRFPDVKIAETLKIVSNDERNAS